MNKHYSMMLTLLFMPSTPHAETPPPTMDFLSFLAEWQDEDGELINPFDYDSVSKPSGFTNQEMENQQFETEQVPKAIQNNHE